MRPPASPNPVAIGLASALVGNTIWGLMPAFWKLVGHIDVFEVLAHRIAWSVPLLALILLVRNRWRALVAVLRDRRAMAILLATTLLVGSNWGVYIWAVQTDQVLSAALGYFLTPLLNVAIGAALFAERPGRWQMIAIGIAVIAVGNLALQAGALPWVALFLGGTFAAYGGLRKLAPAGAMIGLFVECTMLLPVAIGFMIWAAANGTARGFEDISTTMLLITGGVLTATPLMCYVVAAKALTYATTGFLFYITPSIAFVLGALVYREPVTGAQLLTFGLIWIALAIYSWDAHLRARAAARATADAESARPPVV